jgi:hypothetical protein
MTRQDYELIANTIINLRSFNSHFESYDHSFDVLTRSLATAFAQRNPLFKEDTFFKACGLTENTQKKEN